MRFIVQGDPRRSLEYVIDIFGPIMFMRFRIAAGLIYRNPKIKVADLRVFGGDKHLGERVIVGGRRQPGFFLLPENESIHEKLMSRER
jgi:hypothetical protein